MKKRIISTFFYMVLFLVVMSSAVFGQSRLYYQIDTLKPGDSTATFALKGECAYYTVMAISESPGGVKDSIYAYNTFAYTSPIRFVGISDATNDTRAVVTSGSSLNYFLWDPYINTLKLVRTNTVWGANWRVILVIKGVTP